MGNETATAFVGRVGDEFRRTGRSIGAYIIQGNIYTAVSVEGPDEDGDYEIRVTDEEGDDYVFDYPYESENGNQWKLVGVPSPVPPLAAKRRRIHLG